MKTRKTILALSVVFVVGVLLNYATIASDKVFTVHDLFRSVVHSIIVTAISGWLLLRK
jgi:hypothetical protein